jgi:hypothetical protein
MNQTPESIIVEILRTEMGLDQQAVWVRDQNKEIPKDQGLYLIVGMVDSQFISAVNNVVPYDIPQPSPTPPISAMKEIQKTISRENIQIDILSRTKSAGQRRWEIIAALRSVFSAQQQEKNYFRIFALPSSFINTSDAEGGSQVNRFSVTVACHVWYIKEKVLYNESGGDFYNDFTQRVDDANTIGEPEGLIEFEITEAGVI